LHTYNILLSVLLSFKTFVQILRHTSVDPNKLL
jgi:hypothetical protein